MNIVNSTYLEQEYPGNTNTSTIISEEDMHKQSISKMISGDIQYIMLSNTILRIIILDSKYSVDDRNPNDSNAGKF